MAYSFAGFNPRHGWHPGAAFPFPDPLAWGFGQAMQQDVPFNAPHGHQWVDISVVAGGGMPQAIAVPPPPYSFAPVPQVTFGQANNGGMPGVHFHNAHGGIGCEPGYDYLFPLHHAKIHIIVSETAPWLNATQYAMRCFNVPTGLTVKEVMQQFGCNNKVAAKNKLHELTQGADGKWYKGITYCGNETKEMAKKIEQIGWNQDRDGIKEDFVWIWLEK